MRKNIQEVQHTALEANPERGRTYCEGGMAESLPCATPNIIQAQVQCSEKKPKKVRKSPQEVLDSLTEEQMRAFLRGRIAMDKQLSELLCDYFLAPDTEHELASTRRALGRLCEQAENAWDNDKKVERLYKQLDIHAEHIRLRLDQGHSLLAAQLALELLNASIDIIGLLDEGADFYDFVSSAIDVLCEAVGREKSPPLLNVIKAAMHCCERQGLDDDAEQLLEAAALMERTASQEAGSAYRLAHLESDEFRRQAVQQCMANGEYQQAADYCKVRMDACKNDHERLPWLKLLQQVYQQSGDEEKQLQALTELVMSEPLAYYEMLRQIYVQRGVWEQTWPALREKLKEELDPTAYADILYREEQWPQLLEMVFRHPEMVIPFGPRLMEYDRRRTIKLYEENIRQRARSATNRSAYAYVCNGIAALHRAGGKEEALKIIEQLQAEYRRKPAFQDELNMLRGSMK